MGVMCFYWSDVFLLECLGTKEVRRGGLFIAPKLPVVVAPSKKMLESSLLRGTRLIWCTNGPGPRAPSPESDWLVSLVDGHQIGPVYLRIGCHISYLLTSAIGPTVLFTVRWIINYLIPESVRFRHIGDPVHTTSVYNDVKFILVWNCFDMTDVLWLILKALLLVCELVSASAVASNEKKMRSIESQKYVYVYLKPCWGHPSQEFLFT